ncbi:DUF6777 domain-containing protein [Dactylosporangium sp. CS-033363]|uniref:DUF6777 domain-containing protein n=1 Tax=Dactylosporangium sp. CS-033363 TaxID=3239935 RepID=UPI003D8DA637
MSYAPQPPRRSRTAAVLGLVLGLVAIVAIAAAIVIVRRGTDVQLEPVNSAGANPFMQNVGKDEPGAGEVGTSSGIGGRYPAETVGLYGGTKDNSSCDKNQMLQFLKANEEKGRAWAETVGTDFSGLDGYFARLTPVVLRADTAVTNHGFKDGKANPLQSVLQAGTAVLVDDHGRPVAKCYCGNPLTAPAAIRNPKYQGVSWNRFAREHVVEVRAAAAVIDVFALVDVQKNTPFGRPRGTSGEQDGPAPDPKRDPSPTPSGGGDGGGDLRVKALRLFDDRFTSCHNSMHTVDRVDTYQFIKGAPADKPGVYDITVVIQPGQRTTEWRVDVPNQKLEPVNQEAFILGGGCQDFMR